MKNVELVKKAKDVVANYKTVYANGMFGQPITDSIIQQKAKQLPKWYTASRRGMLYGLVGQDYFGFDCVCFIKSLLFWNWSGDSTNVNGGAKYEGKTDVTEKQLLDLCSESSWDFSNIEVGEYLWTEGHCGIYIGDGLAIECTSKWDNGVQITAVHNIAAKQGYNGRHWEKHGKLPTVEYIAEAKDEESKNQITVILPELKKGSKGNEVATLQRLLKSLGYDIGWYGADGDFGNATDSAVKKFQQDKKIACDGIVGYNTWCKILAIQ